MFLRSALLSAVAAMALASAATALAQLPNCPADEWSESKAGQTAQSNNFHWTIGIHDDTLYARRSDGFVSGGFHKAAGNKWVGSLDWNGAGVWNVPSPLPVNIVIPIPVYWPSAISRIPSPRKSPTASDVSLSIPIGPPYVAAG